MNPDNAAARQKKKGVRGMKRKIKYSSDMPRLLYTFFITHSDTASAPSFSKFARSIGATLSDVEGWRAKSEFERAYRECNEIRKDYLIDSALTKRFDSSFVKFLLSAEFKMGEEERDKEDNSLAVTVEVISDEVCENQA